MAAQSDINFFMQFGKKLKTFFFSKDLLSFLLFIALSSAFWFLHALDKECDTNLLLPVRYIGVPKNISIGSQLPSKISVSVKDKGLNLLTYSNSRPKPLVIDLSQFFQAKGEFSISSEQLKAKLRSYLLPSTQLVEFSPNSIVVQYESMFRKTIPVAFFTHIELASQYIQSRTIQLSPREITVFGSKKSLDKLKQIQSEFVLIKEISDTTTLTCKLKPIPGIHFLRNRVNVRIFVEQFTEKKIQLPVNSLNCPANLRIRTFPAYVNVTYRIGLSQFNNVDPTSISVYFDYNDLVFGKQGKQQLKYKNKSAHISNIRIQPQEIELLLEKK